MPLGVGTDVGDVAHVVYRSVFGDVIVVAAFGEALAFVQGVEGGGGEVACATGCGAMHHNEGDVSLFDHCLEGFKGDDYYVGDFFSCVFLFCPPSVPLGGRHSSGRVVPPLAAGRSPTEDGLGCSRGGERALRRMGMSMGRSAAFKGGRQFFSVCVLNGGILKGRAEGYQYQFFLPGGKDAIAEVIVGLLQCFEQLGVVLYPLFETDGC